MSIAFTKHIRMFVPRRRRIGGGAASVEIEAPVENHYERGEEPIRDFTPGEIEVNFPDPNGDRRPATFMFWSVRGAAEGDFTQADPRLVATTGTGPVDATAWYCLQGGVGGGGEGGELETDAFLVARDEFIEPTPIERVSPASAWDHGDANEFVFTTEASSVFALGSVGGPDEHFERWHAIEGAATAAGDELQVPAKDAGIAVASYVPPKSGASSKGRVPSLRDDQLVVILGHVAAGSSGAEIVGGVIHRVGPRGPLMAAALINDLAANLDPKSRVAVQTEALRSIDARVKELEKGLAVDRKEPAKGG